MDYGKLRELSKKVIGCWVDLAYKLGVDRYTIQEISMKQCNPSDKAFDMLIAWSDNCPVESQRSMLISALRQVNQSRLADDLEADCNRNVIATDCVAEELVDKAGKVWGTVNELLHSGSGRHNLLVGTPKLGDILLHEERKCPSFKLLGCVTHVFQYIGNKEITAVVARDNWDDETGGDPEIISGGVGQKHVQVKVTSQFARGFNHTVYVYGKK